MGFLLMECVPCLKFLSQNSEIEYGFLVFGCLTQVCNVLGVFLIFGLGLKVWQYSYHCKGIIQFLCDIRGKSSDLRSGFCSKNDFGEVCDSKILSCKCGLLRFFKNSNPPMIDKLEETKELVYTNGDYKEKDVLDDDDDEEECYDEDEEVDVMALRKLIKFKRRRANAVCLELEKERMAAASAAEEAMAMILRLQNEKSSIEMQANQYRKLAEQKQLYDKEVIESLRWIVMKHESERSLLENQLSLCMRKLKQYEKGDEVDQFEGVYPMLNFFNSATEDGLDDVLISSIDMDAPPV